MMTTVPFCSKFFLEFLSKIVKLWTVSNIYPVKHVPVYTNIKQYIN